ncbi:MULTISPECIES: NUDIX hydrolase [unclassified Isoptericola]|uniref:NUDIX hydrolase n=1 Tax=unclassified Isoptericola TaxID=2623355 RepID=UPI002713ACA1|nr:MULTISPECIES: NUDIX hydrolase [unclassified Isoptericola]MDO8143772.1 NUDIX hydrolase [Isoptericola sp. 178]MDO8147673.1 NUDIX hydrolase [Isoptericola sp. b515]MDO8150027.1 NUDIX hydrolase [Isoptericola sp. b408]
MSSAVPAPGAPEERPPVPVPVPPGGHPLKVDPARLRRRATVPSTAGSTGHLPVVDETSAGGLVVERHVSGHRAAVILRRNRAGRLEMCLPKGHLEGAETPEEAAVREIREETGIQGTVRRTLGVIDYWFSGEDRRVHKVVHHFLLRADGGLITAADDPDGEAEDARWVPLTELPDRLAYPNEQRLAATALHVLTHTPDLVE